jgi:hypothetical protein
MSYGAASLRATAQRPFEAGAVMDPKLTIEIVSDVV